MIHFNSMSAGLFTGLALLTLAILAALQFLRAKPEKIRVITSMFWKDSIKQEQSRTLLGSFQNPRTYLLLAAIALLALLALADPIFGSKNTNKKVIALEAGLEMSTKDNRFNKALELAWDESRSLGEANVAVVVADPYPRVIKHFNEGIAILESRLAKIKPSENPSSRDKLLKISKSLINDAADSQISLITAQSTSINDEKITIFQAGEQTNNIFILSSIYHPSATSPNSGDLHCQVGYTGDAPSTFTININKNNQSLKQETFEIQPGSTKSFVASKIIADGSSININIEGDDQITGDNTNAFLLPNRKPILLIAENGFDLPPALKAVIESLPSVTTQNIPNSNQSPIRIGPAGSNAEIQIHKRTTSKEFIPVTTTSHPAVKNLNFEDGLSKAPQNALKNIADSKPLLTANNTTLAALNSEKNQLHISEALLDKDASIVKRAAYFVFWAKLIQHLAGWTEEPLTLSPELIATNTDANASPNVMKASFSNFNSITKGDTANISKISDTRTPAWFWLLLLALALMITEAILHIRRKIT